jgi:hypothetical protein
MSDPPSKALAEKLTKEEIEAWNMWVYKTHNILPTQYHHFYNQGETLIYPEHIQDLLVIDQMWGNKIKRQQNKERAKMQGKNNPLTKNNKGLGGFYGNTFKYSK